jgi:hypothetical protein
MSIVYPWIFDFDWMPNTVMLLALIPLVAGMVTPISFSLAR